MHRAVQGGPTACAGLWARPAGYAGHWLTQCAGVPRGPSRVPEHMRACVCTSCHEAPLAVAAGHEGTESRWIHAASWVLAKSAARSNILRENRNRKRRGSNRVSGADCIHGVLGNEICTSEGCLRLQHCVKAGSAARRLHRSFVRQESSQSMRCERCRRKRFRGGSAELEESSVFLSSEKDDAGPLAAQVRGRANH